MIIKSSFTKNLMGQAISPPDKSISHRAIILAALAKGTSTIENLLESEDTCRTLLWAKQLGVKVEEHRSGLLIRSYGLNAKIATSSIIINCGNSGTTARLTMGVMSAYKGSSVFCGDSSLHKRPMARVVEPLVKMGVKIWRLQYKPSETEIAGLHQSGKKLATNTIESLGDESFHKTSYKNGMPVSLPIIIQGGKLKAIEYKLAIPSAQVKSAILLAGLFAEGATTVIESLPCRDHTENMLISAGLKLKITQDSNQKIISLPLGEKSLNPMHWQIPGDFSSAAFIIFAALIVPNSGIAIKNVNLNPLRSGLLKTLHVMGANIIVINERRCCNEPLADLVVKYTPELRPIHVEANSVGTMIDEFPILFCLASLAKGISTFSGIQELRYKESDRIAKLEEMLTSVGVKTHSTLDSLVIHGGDLNFNQGLSINATLDHRVAMSAAILGLKFKFGAIIKGGEAVNSSFPSFVPIMNALGANISISLG